jgi:hypothetical protein
MLLPTLLGNEPIYDSLRISTLKAHQDEVRARERHP